MSGAALFVFAHQDDEMAAASRIAFELARGATVYCAFLTDGGGGKASPQTRNHETTTVLTLLGIPKPHILFIGSDFGIRDGVLVEHLDLALERLEAALTGIELGTIYCLAWEGGHQDHDASHLVAVAFARRRAILDRCFELPLYRGATTFRVLAPLAGSTQWERRRLTFREGLRYSLLARHYPSQRKSWLGLFPELFLKVAILRRETLRPVDASRLRMRPHAGRLLYEWRFKFPHERFASAASGFVEEHLACHPERL